MSLSPLGLWNYNAFHGISQTQITKGVQMKTQEVLEYFSDPQRLYDLRCRSPITAVAKVLGIERNTPHYWGEYPSELAQWKLQHVTRGKLKVEKDLLPPIVK